MKLTEHIAKGQECAVHYCGKPIRGRIWCAAHYARWKRHGDPLSGQAPKGAAMAWVQAHVTWQGDSCLRWPFKFSTAYPTIRLPSGKIGRAHRLMCELANGPAPEKAFALHSCGNRWCVNPGHIRWGTPAENVADSIAHGTFARGERMGHSKLTAETVRAARRDRSAGMNYLQLEQKYGISRGALWHAIRGSQWGHVHD